MTTPLAGIPFLRRTEGIIPARPWSLWLRWRRRHGPVLEFALAARPGTRVLMNDECWLFFDDTGGGMPIILWLDFAPPADAIHADVPCFVQYYDYPGARFHDSVLEEAARRMEEDLRGP